MSRVLDGAEASDWLTYLVVCIKLLAMAMMASYLST